MKEHAWGHTSVRPLGPPHTRTHKADKQNCKSSLLWPCPQILRVMHHLWLRVRQPLMDDEKSSPHAWKQVNCRGARKEGLGPTPQLTKWHSQLLCALPFFSLHLTLVGLKLSQRHYTCRVALTNGFSGSLPSSLPGPAREPRPSRCCPCQFCSRSGSLHGLVLVIGSNQETPGPQVLGTFSFFDPDSTFSTGTNQEIPTGNSF